MILLPLAYVCKYWTKKQVQYLTSGYDRVEDSEKRAELIANRITKFEITNKYYFSVYCVTEFLHFMAFVAIFVYYFAILGVQHTGIAEIVEEAFNHYEDRGDYIVKLFPRQIICLYKTDDELGNVIKKDITCNLAHQEYNEWFHIIAFLLSCIVIGLYLINIIYVTINFLRFSAYAINPTQMECNIYNELGLNTKLIIILLYNNMDRLSHDLLMKKIAAKSSKIVPDKINEPCIQQTTSNEIQENKNIVDKIIDDLICKVIPEPINAPNVQQTMCNEIQKKSKFVKKKTFNLQLNFNHLLDNSGKTPDKPHEIRKPNHILVGYLCKEN